MTATKLTKIQRSVLEAAARRNDLAAWPIRDGKLNIGSATRVMKELVRRGLVIELPVIAKAPIWREDDKGRPLMAVISDDGLAAIGMSSVDTEVRSSRPAGKKGAGAAAKAAVAAVSLNKGRRPRPGTKLAILIELLERERGSTIAELSEAVGWQAPSTRGVLSGMLQKKFGLEIVSEKIEGGGRTYRQRR